MRRFVICISCGTRYYVTQGRRTWIFCRYCHVYWTPRRWISERLWMELQRYSAKASPNKPVLA